MRDIVDDSYSDFCFSLYFYSSLTHFSRQTTSDQLIYFTQNCIFDNLFYLYKKETLFTNNNLYILFSDAATKEKKKDLYFKLYILFSGGIDPIVFLFFLV